jgi:hypothetical protein
VQVKSTHSTARADASSNGLVVVFHDLNRTHRDGAAALMLVDFDRFKDIRSERALPSLLPLFLLLFFASF